MSLPGSHPARVFEGTGDTDLDIAFLGLPDDKPLDQIIEVDILKKSADSVWIDFPNSTNVLLKVKAGGGVTWKICITGRNFIVTKL